MSAYWVRYGDLTWVEVDKAEYVRVERVAGFHNTLGQPEEPGTAAFSNGVLEGTTIRPRESEAAAQDHAQNKSEARRLEGEAW